MIQYTLLLDISLTSGNKKLCRALWIEKQTTVIFLVFIIIDCKDRSSCEMHELFQLPTN